MTRIVGGRGKASGLDSADGRVTEAMTEITGDAQYLDGPRRRDTNPDRDIAFDMKLFGLRGVLWLGFEENLGCALGCRRRRSYRLWHRRRKFLYVVYRTANR